MLTINFYDYDGNSDVDKSKLIDDVDKAFFSVRITGTDKERAVLKEIDRAEYNSSNTFIDRFGVRLPTSDLSTGCKAALVVLHNPDKIVNCIECGNNARDSIIRNCSDGSILLEDNGVTFRYGNSQNNSIDVCVDGYKFRDIDSLNSYVRDIMWCKEYKGYELSKLERA